MGKRYSALSSGRVISSSQRPPPDNTQHLQQTDIHDPGGIWTHNLSRLAATDLCLRPRGHWETLAKNIYIYIYTSHYLNSAPKTKSVVPVSVCYLRLLSKALQTEINTACPSIVVLLLGFKWIKLNKMSSALLVTLNLVWTLHAITRPI